MDGKKCGSRASMKAFKDAMKMHLDKGVEGPNGRPIRSNSSSGRNKTQVEWCREQRLKHQADYDDLMEARTSIDNLMAKVEKESEWARRMTAGIMKQMEPGVGNNPLPPDFDFFKMFFSEPSPSKPATSTSIPVAEVEDRTHPRPVLAWSLIGNEEAVIADAEPNDSNDDGVVDSVNVDDVTSENNTGKVDGMEATHVLGLSVVQLSDMEESDGGDTSVDGDKTSQIEIESPKKKVKLVIDSEQEGQIDDALTQI